MIKKVNIEKVAGTENAETAVLPNDGFQMRKGDFTTPAEYTSYEKFQTKNPSCNIQDELIKACKKGDPKAQFKVYKMFYKAMYNPSLNITNDPILTEDIVQESFLVAFEKIGSFSGSISFYAWLKRIVENLSIEILSSGNALHFNRELVQNNHQM